jgi:hypothetical protein
MTTANAYRNWFKSTVENALTDIDFPAHLKPKDFFYADSSRFIAATRSDIDYPCLVLEVPTYYLAPNFTSNYLKSLRGAFSIVKGCTLDDYDAQDDAMNDCEQIGVIVLKKLKEFIKPQGAFFKGDIIEESVLSLIVDNNYGYRFEYYIENLHFSQLSPCP